ncbi:hypothetical protein OSB04_un000464 [Centaurea solstitialis]|uniref:Uncharacterized protein n=1 Tax=Centaurea solstitialis TaxID=347529 RepID=A0AA38VVI2_9ASTR|nr:hypothetical protein OSB04_un000464 [Centaurea solstitialis]
MVIVLNFGEGVSNGTAKTGPNRNRTGTGITPRRLEREERETRGFIRYGFREEREPVALPASP